MSDKKQFFLYLIVYFNFKSYDFTVESASNLKITLLPFLYYNKI